MGNQEGGGAGGIGEAVWFALYRIQEEATRVSDHSAQEGIGTLPDQLLHLPPSVGSSQPGGAGGREQSDLERLRLECCGNPGLSWVG